MQIVNPDNEIVICMNIISWRSVCFQNPYFHTFEPLIARACEMFWLTSEEIKQYMEKVCAHRLMTANIDWQPIFATINYKEE